MLARAAVLLIGVLAAVPDSTTEPCPDRDGDGFHSAAGCGTEIDCNDADPATHPSAPESCNGLDDDCDGAVDDDEACLRSCDDAGGGRDDHLVDISGTPLGISVVWTGAGFGTAWSEVHSGEERLRFASWTTAGILVDTVTTLRARPGIVRGPSLAWTGTEWAVAWWDDTSGTGTIYFSLIDSQGHPVGVPLEISDGARLARWPSLIWAGSRFGVAWFEENAGFTDIVFATIDADGTVGPSRPLTDASQASYPLLAWSGSAFGVAWVDTTGPASLKRFLRIDPAGTPLGEAVDVGPGRVDTLLWTGTAFAISGPDRSNGTSAIRLSRLDGGGDVLDTEVPLASSGDGGRRSSLAWTGAEFGLSWKDSGGQIRFARFHERGFPLSAELPASDIGVSSRTPALLWTGAEYDVVWVRGAGTDSTLEFDQIHCTCFDGDGDGYDRCLDCDDDDPATSPVAEEIGCDSVDNDCNPATSDVTDGDGDGYLCLYECDDNDPAVNPGEDEVACDGRDNDCDPGTPDLVDSDGDGFACVDCDGDDPDVHPAAEELSCDGVDNDCNPATPDVFDADGDGFICDEECDDTTADAAPGLTEVLCDGLDNDCDPTTTDLADLDQDGFICDLDCDESDPAINPDAVEICDGVDNDCDGSDLHLVDPFAVDDRNTRPTSLTPIWIGSRFGVASLGTQGTGTAEFRSIQLGQYDLPGNELGWSRLAGGSLIGRYPAAAYSGDEWAIVYGYVGALNLSRIGTDGPIGDRVPLTDASGNPRHPAIVWTGEAYGITWIEDGPVGPRLRFARVSVEGAVSHLVVVADDVESDERRFSMAWTGTTIGVAWDRDDGIGFARLDPFGNPLDEPTVVVPDALPDFGVSVSWTGAGYALAWDDGGEVHFARLDPSGEPLGAAFRVPSVPAGSRRVTMVWNGSRFGIAYEYRNEGVTQAYLARLDASGSVLGQAQQVSQSTNHLNKYPAVFWTGVDFGVVYQDEGRLHYSLPGCGCFDEDADGYGGCFDCNDADPEVHPAALETCNGVDDDCDGWIDEDMLGEDTDRDGRRNLCDNCLLIANPSQADVDDDLEGDACDLDDGTIALRFSAQDALEWQEEVGFDSWNLYRGGLDVLRGGGSYTQRPESSPLAERICGLVDAAASEDATPSAGETAFFLVTGAAAGVESGLGTDSAGSSRPNDYPCP